MCPLALAAALGGGEPCPLGKTCRRYHPYVRPSTAEIIARLYPKRNGHRAKAYPSGAVHEGTVVDEVFQVRGRRRTRTGGEGRGRSVKESARLQAEPRHGHKELDRVCPSLSAMALSILGRHRSGFAVDEASAVQTSQWCRLSDAAAEEVGSCIRTAFCSLQLQV